MKLQEAWLPDASVAVQFTLVVPEAKQAPDGGEQLEEAPEQLSDTVAAG